MAIITNWGIHTVSPLFPLDVENEAALGKTNGTNGVYVRGRLDFKALLGTTIPQNGFYQSVLNTLNLTTNSIPRVIVNTSTIDLNLLTRVTSGSGNGIDTITASTLYIGQTNATDIHIGHSTNTVYIHSNLDVIGDITYLHTQTLQVKDKNIEVNLDGSTLLAEGSGLSVLGDSNLDIASILFDSTLASKWKVGTNLAQSEIVTATDTQSVYNKTVGNFAFSPSDCALNSVNNYSTADKGFIRFTHPTLAVTLTGFANGYDGKQIEIINRTTYPLVIQHDNVGSSVGNRVFLENLNFITLPIDGYLRFIYDNGYWRTHSSTYFGFIPDWTATTFYSIGQTVMSVGLGGKRKTWRCVTAHLSGVSIVPNLSYWEIAGGGGTATIDVVAGEGLTKGDAAYVCYSALDTGRTIGYCYKLDVSNYYRRNYAGLVEATCLLGDTASIIVSGAVDTVTGIVSFDEDKEVWGSSTPGSSTQTPVIATGYSWRVPTAKALSPSQVVVVHKKPFRVGNTTLVNGTTDITGLKFIDDELEYSGFYTLCCTYVARITGVGSETGKMNILYNTEGGTQFEVAVNSVGQQLVTFDIDQITGQVNVTSSAAGTISWKVKELSGAIF